MSTSLMMLESNTQFHFSQLMTYFKIETSATNLLNSYFLIGFTKTGPDRILVTLKLAQYRNDYTVTVGFD